MGVGVMDRRHRSPELTLEYVQRALEAPDLLLTLGAISRDLAERHLSIERFRQDWRSYVQDMEDGRL